MMLRHLEWDGCFNARDLGGLRARDGEREIRRGALVRADALEELTAEGWKAVLAHGIRTIIDLRNDDEREDKSDVAARPSGMITTTTMPIDNIHDEEFWSAFRGGWQFGTPLFYAPHVKRFPEATAGVVRAIAEAEPGGVLFHCAGGRDRTGLVTMLVLSLLDIGEADIVGDYVESRDRLRALYKKREDPDASKQIDDFLAGRGQTLESCMTEAIRAVDMASWRESGKLDDETLKKLRHRLLT